MRCDSNYIHHGSRLVPILTMMSVLILAFALMTISILMLMFHISRHDTSTQIYVKKINTYISICRKRCVCKYVYTYDYDCHC